VFTGRQENIADLGICGHVFGTHFVLLTLLIHESNLNNLSPLILEQSYEVAAVEILVENEGQVTWRRWQIT